MLLSLYIIIGVVGGAIFLSYLQYRYLRKNKYGKWLIFLPVVIGGLILYGGYFAFFPDDDYYRGLFHDITGVWLPDNAVFLATSSSPPVDPHGDYCSASLILVEENTYNDLLEKIQTDTRFDSNQLVGSDELVRVVGSRDNYKSMNFTYKASRFAYTDVYNFVGFLDDGRTLVTEQCAT